MNTSPNGDAGAVPPARPPRPKAPAPFDEVIPEELRGRPRWVTWRYEYRAPRWTKIPYCPTDPRAKAKADVPSTWATFEEAMIAFPAHDFDGIGFEFAADDPYLGVDVDNCLRGGEVLPWAAAILSKLEGTYGEISPSGNGIKFIARGKLPADKGTRKGGMGPDGTGALELYDHGRFFTITGDAWDRSGIADRQQAAEELYRIAKGRPSRPSKPSARTAGSSPPAPSSNGIHTDREVLDAASRHARDFDALYGGDTGHYPTPSEADLALMNKLAWLCGPGQAEQVKRLFLGSRLGRRDKAGREDYVGRTVAKAYDGKSAFFDWTPGTNGRAAGNGAPPPEAPALADTLPPPHRTDVGNGERLVGRAGRDLRYCHPWSQWLVWDGRRWKVDDTAAAVRSAKATARAILEEAAALGGDELKQHVRWWRESEGSSRINAMLTMAASEEGIPALPDQLDSDPWLFNARNGTVDLRTGMLGPHRREDLITALAPVEYHPAAKCPAWITILDRIFDRRTELIQFFKRLCGLALTGVVTEQILPILWGTGANGKSTLLGALLELMGEDYAMMAPPGLLLVKRHESHPTERATLFGKRLVVDMESAEGARLNEPLVKQLTGADRISARRMREDFWDFTPTHKLMMGTNHRPEIRETKNAIWRRVKLIPFTVTIPEAEQIKDLPRRLRAEYPGILAWAVRGCLDWQQDGLNPPQEVVDATAEYRAEQDALGAFIAEECTVNAQLSAKASVLYERYREREGCVDLTQRAFGRAMTERGFARYESHGIWYRGIGLRSDGSDFDRVPD
jgi:putative DNA primase/helicase